MILKRRRRKPPSMATSAPTPLRRCMRCCGFRKRDDLSFFKFLVWRYRFFVNRFAVEARFALRLAVEAHFACCVVAMVWIFLDFLVHLPRFLSASVTAERNNRRRSRRACPIVTHFSTGTHSSSTTANFDQVQHNATIFGPGAAQCNNFRPKMGHDVQHVRAHRKRFRASISNQSRTCCTS